MGCDRWPLVTRNMDSFKGQKSSLKEWCYRASKAAYEQNLMDEYRERIAKGSLLILLKAPWCIRSAAGSN